MPQSSFTESNFENAVLALVRNLSNLHTSMVQTSTTRELWTDASL